VDTNPTPEVTPEQDLLNALGGDESQDDTEDQAQTDSDESTDDAPAEDSEQEQPDADVEEVELSGEKLTLPKKAAEAVRSLQKDYTLKTQAAAELRRTAEDRSQYLDAREHILKSTFQEAAKLQAKQERLEQFAALDWNALIAEDPQQAMRLSMARQELHSEVAQGQQAVQTLVANAEQAKQLHQSKQQELGRAELLRRVGPLNEADRKRTYEQGVAIGYSDHELNTIADPRIMHALYKAAQWDALQAAKPKAMQKVAQAPAAVKTAAPTPMRQRQNQAALERLKTNGRPKDLMSFL